VRNKFGLVILGVMLVGVSGCSSVPNAVNPISWYRDVTGLSKNDDLGKGQNEQNLAEGSDEPYPNLGNVPSAPDNQLSGVDRDKLVKSLVADRNNAQYSADNLRAGDVASTVPPPAPPAPKPDTSSATISSATISSAPESPPPEIPPPPPTAPAPAESSNAAPPPPPPAASPPAPAPSPAATAAAVPPPAAAPVPSPNKAAANNTQQRKPPVRGSEAPPAESSLQSPSIPNLPQGETPTPAPPPPSTRGPAVHSPSGTATQQATAPANAPATAAAHRPGVSYRVADVSFAPGSAYLSGALRGTIAEIVKIHNTEGGTIRIVGFGESTGKDAAVAGLTLALDRAQAVAVALTDSGVAAKDIAVEAAPVAAKGGTDAPRAEVYIEQ
jgi:outer membrane protein OmpA-like peptidoglycan-associated protein